MEYPVTTIKTSPQKIVRFLTLSFGSLVILTLTACAIILPSYEKPRVSLSGISVKTTKSISPVLVLTLNVENPNDFSFDIDGVNLEFELNGQPLARGLSDQKVTVPRYGNARLSVETSIEMFSFLRQILALTTQQEFTYAFKGHAHVTKGWFSNQNIEFSEEGRLDATEIFDDEQKPRPKSRMERDSNGVF